MQEEWCTSPYFGTIRCQETQPQLSARAGRHRPFVTEPRAVYLSDSRTARSAKITGHGSGQMQYTVTAFHQKESAAELKISSYG